MRFLAPRPRLSSSELDYLTAVDHVRHEALIAVDPETGRASAQPAISATATPRDRGVRGWRRRLVDGHWPGNGTAQRTHHPRPRGGHPIHGTDPYRQRRDQASGQEGGGGLRGKWAGQGAVEVAFDLPTGRPTAKCQPRGIAQREPLSPGSTRRFVLTPQELGSGEKRLRSEWRSWPRRTPGPGWVHWPVGVGSPPLTHLIGRTGPQADSIVLLCMESSGLRAQSRIVPPVSSPIARSRLLRAEQRECRRRCRQGVAPCSGSARRG